MELQIMGRSPSRPPLGAPLSFRVPDEVKAAIEQAAEADDRPVSRWIERLIVRELQRQGLLPEDNPRSRRPKRE